MSVPCDGRQQHTQLQLQMAKAQNCLEALVTYEPGVGVLHALLAKLLL